MAEAHAHHPFERSPFFPSVTILSATRRTSFALATVVRILSCSISCVTIVLRKTTGRPLPALSPRPTSPQERSSVLGVTTELAELDHRAVHPEWGMDFGTSIDLH
jgi:hypothetical protein